MGRVRLPPPTRNRGPDSGSGASALDWIVGLRIKTGVLVLCGMPPKWAGARSRWLRDYPVAAIPCTFFFGGQLAPRRGVGPSVCPRLFRRGSGRGFLASTYQTRFRGSFPGSARTAPPQGFPGKGNGGPQRKRTGPPGEPSPEGLAGEGDKLSVRAARRLRPCRPEQAPTRWVVFQVPSSQASPEEPKGSHSPRIGALPYNGSLRRHGVFSGCQRRGPASRLNTTHGAM